MKAVLNIVAAVLVAAGLVVAVASLMTPGQVILGIDFKLAATLIVGGLILLALASALTLLERMSHDLRQLRRAGNEEPPWLRQSAAAMAAAASAAALAEEALAEDRGDEPEDEFGFDAAGEPTEASPVLAHEDESQDLEPTEEQVEIAPELEPAEAAVEDQTELPIEFEPSEAVIEDQAVAEREPPDFRFVDDAEFEPEPDPHEATVFSPSEFEPEADPTEATILSPSEFEPEADPTEATPVSEAEVPSFPEPHDDAAHAEAANEPEPVVEDAAVADEADAAGEPELFEDPFAGIPGSPSRLRPSHDTFAADREPEPSEPPHAQEHAVEEPAVEEHAALYVVEERVFRGRQARVLSDGTIEAETAEGWMRFEDFDHLEEYLEAMAELGR